VEVSVSTYSISLFSVSYLQLYVVPTYLAVSVECNVDFTAVVRLQLVVLNFFE